MAMARRMRRDEQGMSFIFVGLGMIAFMAATTLAIDVGMFMPARTQAQTAADSAAEVAARCPVVVLSLPTPAVVRSVVDELATASPGPMVRDTSTIGPDTAQGCRERLAEAGGDYADCPILGRPESVGSWTIPVGGTPAAAATSEEVLAPVARRVVRVGEVGAAATLKVLNNLMLGAINAVTAEVLVLSQASGLDPAVFVDTVVDSGAASVSGLFKDDGPRAVSGDFRPTFSLELMGKDNGLALDLADRHRVPMPVGRAAQLLNTMGLAAGLGGQDSIAVVRVLEQLTGHRVGAGQGM